MAFEFMKLTIVWVFSSAIRMIKMIKFQMMKMLSTVTISFKEDALRWFQTIDQQQLNRIASFRWELYLANNQKLYTKNQLCQTNENFRIFQTHKHYSEKIYALYIFFIFFFLFNFSSWTKWTTFSVQFDFMISSISCSRLYILHDNWKR